MTQWSIRSTWFQSLLSTSSLKLHFRPKRLTWPKGVKTHHSLNFSAPYNTSDKKVGSPLHPPLSRGPMVCVLMIWDRINLNDFLIMFWFVCSCSYNYSMFLNMQILLFIKCKNLKWVSCPPLVINNLFHLSACLLAVHLTLIVRMFTSHFTGKE